MLFAWENVLEVIPIDEIADFHEAPMFQETVFTGYRFSIRGEDGREIVFNTQLPGWAAAVERLHQEIPWVVPAASALEARLVISHMPMDPWAAALTGPGQDIPEEWQWAKRQRWYDAYLSFIVVALVVGVPAPLPS